MRRLLGNMLLWTASRLGLLGFRLRGEDTRDCCCYLQLNLTPDKQHEAYARAWESTMRAIVEIERGALNTGVTVGDAAKELN